MAKGRRLKVFQAQFGFYDTVVAASSQAAALRIWGARQNLFASGQAKVATDERAVAAALAHPEVPLKRPIGSDDPFELEPKALPTIPDTPRPSQVKAVAGPKKTPPLRPAADRSALDAAEAALRLLDDERRHQEAEFRRRQGALEAEQEAAQTAYVQGRKAATSAVVKARRSYREAGGRA